MISVICWTSNLMYLTFILNNLIRYILPLYMIRNKSEILYNILSNFFIDVRIMYLYYSQHSLSSFQPLPCLSRHSYIYDFNYSYHYCNDYCNHMQNLLSLTECYSYVHMFRADNLGLNNLSRGSFLQKIYASYISNHD